MRSLNRDASKPRQVGAFVVLVGPDGAGKTTLAAALAYSRSGETGYFHFLPPLRGPLPPSPPENPAPPPPKHDSTEGSKVLGILRLLRNLVRFRIGYLATVRPALRRGALVLGDRWGYGYVVQPTPLKYYGPELVARWVIRLLPRPDLVVNLSAPHAVIHSRKQELSLEVAQAELERWRNLDEPRLVTLDATLPPQRNAEIVLDWLGGASTLYKPFPPGLGHVKVPTSSRGAAQAGMAMYAACKQRPLISQRLAILAVGLFGTGVLPGRTIRWNPPMSDTTWRNLTSRWRDELGAFDAVAIHEGRRKRSGFALLLIRDASAVAFVRMAKDSGDSVASEAETLAMVAAATPRFFHVPRLLATGRCNGWRYLASSAFSGRHIPPVDPPVEGITTEIRHALAALPRPVGTPEHWVPMHGDFTPWNLRQVGNDLVLTDWEDAGWGPFGADTVRYRATEAALRGTRPVATHTPEAVDYWIGRLLAGEDRTGARRIRQRVLRALDQMLD